MRCALRACRPRLRRSAGSTILRGSPSSTDRLPAPRFRHSRGPAQRTLRSTAVVQLEVDMSSTMGLQSRSGACCTFTRTLFCLTFEPRHHSQEAACADADLRLRAGQLELERGWPRISRPIRTITPLLPRILLPCAICSHVAVAILGRRVLERRGGRSAVSRDFSCNSSCNVHYEGMNSLFTY